MELGYKQSERFHNIEWLMEIIDVATCLERLNIRMTKKSGNDWEGYCPDHHLFKGVEPSDPRWYLNINTGKTCCQTESRGSNFLYVTARLLKGNGFSLQQEDYEKAIQFLTQRDCTEGEISFLRNKNLLKRLSQEKLEKPKAKKTWVEDIVSGMKSGYLSPRALKYFIAPPDKPVTNIVQETLIHYGVFEKTNGYYSNRAMVPIIQNKEVLGFIAIDLLGKKKWIETHPTSLEKDYKKTLYPSTETGFFKKEVLFGMDDCQKNADHLIVTEGAREVMKLCQEGYTNSVAILGGYLSDEQLMLMTKLAPKKLILMFDGDQAGRKIADMVCLKTKELFNVSIIDLPQGVDPKQLQALDFKRLIG